MRTAKELVHALWFRRCPHPKESEVDTWAPHQKRGDEPRYLCADCDENGELSRPPGISDLEEFVEAIRAEQREAIAAHYRVRARNAREDGLPQLANYFLETADDVENFGGEK